jgi:uncharacterized repeat protein (TIGR01451 family)
VTYTITAKNNGSAPQAGVKISDSFPSAISSDSYTATGTGNATGFTATGSGNISDTVTMPPGSTITYTVHANISPDATGDLVNPAKVDPPAGTTDKTPSDNQATDTDQLIPVADLKAVKTGPAKVVPGTNATYTVTVSNAGPSSASDATVTDAVPAGSTFASETHSTGWTCTTPAPGSAGTITCGPARLRPQTSATFTFVVHAGLGAVGTTLHNTANASSSAMDPNPGDNQSQQVDTQVKCDNNLSSASTAVTLSGGSWCVYDGKMASSVTVSAGTTAIFVRTSVGNALTARSPGTIAVCASTVRGALSVTGATGPVTIGDPGDDGCAANSLLSDVTLGSNKSSAELVGNKVSGTVTATGNSGKGPFPDDVGVEIESNSISGGLGCSGNTPVASNDHHPNSVSGSRSGQCASQTF